MSNYLLTADVPETKMKLLVAGALFLRTTCSTHRVFVEVDVVAVVTAIVGVGVVGDEQEGVAVCEGVEDVLQRPTQQHPLLFLCNIIYQTLHPEHHCLLSQHKR